MSPEYLQLARERSLFVHPRYRQPEYFGYNFREWVSPYTKGAHQANGHAFILQDWASESAFVCGVNPIIQELGRNPTIKTNRYFEELLQRVFGLELRQTYVTNAFPFVKSGSMSAPIPMSDVVSFATRFAKKELELARPKRVFALGRVAHLTLTSVGIDSVALPHPAARIGGINAHETAWREAIGNHFDR